MSGKHQINSFIITILCTLISGIISFAGCWQQDANGLWYQFEDGTYPAGGMYTIDGNSCVFDKSGYLVTNQWVQFSDGTWSYCTAFGTVAKNQWIENTYYVDSNGRMLKNAYAPNGLYLGSDGKWTTPPSSSFNNTSNSSTYSSSNSNNSSSSGNSRTKKYTKDEIFEMADPYVANIPGARRLTVSDFGYAAWAMYTTNNGIYRVDFIRDSSAALLGGSVGYIYSKSGYTR